MDNFELELKQGFLEEAAQLLSDTEQCFLTLETNSDDPSILEKIFRLAHNLKGSAKAVGFEDMGIFAHQFESFLLKVKHGEIKVEPSVVSLLLKCNDHFKLMVEELKKDVNAKVDSETLKAEIQAFEAGQKKPSEETISLAEVNMLKQAESVALPQIMQATPEPVAEPAAPEVSQPPKLPTESAPQPVSTVEEELDTVQPPVTELPPAASKLPPPKSPTAADESIRISLVRLERLINFVGEMVILQTVLREQAYSSNTLLLRKTVHQLGKVTKEVQDISMGLRMVPLKQTFQKMQRIVRDTSAGLGKKVNLVLQGEDTELDKTVLENVSDPLVHLIRNAVDHGVENPDVRAASGKKEAGTIHLNAFHQGGKLVIEVKDDGAGINADVLRKKAVEKGILKPGQTISDRDAIHLIFHSGFSTKAQVTEVSGRGVGMDVVKTNIEQLQGEVLVDTEIGKGTTFKILLPLTLAIIDGMIVKSESSRFVIPLSHIHETVRPTPKDVQKTSGIGEILMLRGENLPLYRLEKLLGRPASAKEPWNLIALVIRTQGTPLAVLVDDIIGQHQVVIKELGNELRSSKGFSGSAILGDGKPSLILEIGELIQRSSGRSISRLEPERRIAV